MGLGLSDDFKKQFEAEGGKVIAMESGLQGDKDFKTQLTRIKGTKPEAIYMPDYVAEMAQILDQTKQLGISAKMLASDGYSNPEIFDLAGDLANGVTFANSAEDKGVASPLRAAFIEKYQKKWGVQPDAFSMNSYDAANILIGAIEQAYKNAQAADQKALKLDRDKIRAGVAGIKDFNGVSGVINFLPEKGDAVKNVGIFVSEKKAYNQIEAYKIEGGKLVKAQ